MKKVLIADDDKGIVEALSTLLEFSGYEPIVPDLRHLLDEVRKSNPNLILLDLKLGSVDSGELFKKLRYDEQLRKIPVIVVSANPDTQKIADSMGADAFIEKPFDMDKLLEMIEHLT